jgi:hypothetical protein
VEAPLSREAAELSPTGAAAARGPVNDIATEHAPPGN